MTTEARNCVYSATQRILAVTAAGLVALFIFAPLQSMVKADTPAAGVSGPVVVIQTIQIPCADGSAACSPADRRLDAQITNFAMGKTLFWFATNSNFMSKFTGGLGNPFAVKLWTRPTRALFGERPVPASVVRDKKWITSIYQAPGGGILGFVHVERAPFGYRDGKGRVGLAWSGDFGESFTYLGPIAAPYRDPDAVNVSGVPYFVKDGYFYAYYIDRCGDEARPATAVIRAPVNDVISAARRGKATAWRKYYDGAWNEPALGGVCTPLFLTEEGIINSDAAWSTYTNKAYLLLTKKGPEEYQLNLYQSKDGITWSLARNIARAPARILKKGYSYSWIVNDAPVGLEKNVVGRRFYIYADRDAAAGPELLERGVVLQWHVDLAALKR